MIDQETIVETKSAELHGGRSKVERWGWRLSGKPAEFAWIAKHRLNVDRSYQRDVSASRIRQLAADWNWVACGAISVALRGDGEWFVIDGQHRVEAARNRSDITDLPCLIFELSGAEEEAQGFLDTNLGRKAMSWVERFNALLRARDATALKLQHILQNSGRVIAKGNTGATVSCVGALIKACDTDEDALRRVWPVVTAAFSGEPIQTNIVQAFFWLETALPDEESLSSKRWRDRISKLSVKEINHAITASLAFRGPGMKSAGLGLLSAINKGLRSPLTIRPELAEVS